MSKAKSSVVTLSVLRLTGEFLRMSLSASTQGLAALADLSSVRESVVSLRTTLCFESVPGVQDCVRPPDAEEYVYPGRTIRWVEFLRT